MNDMNRMHEGERAELNQLAADERLGRILTGEQKGRLADLRRAEILETVAGWLTSSPEPAPPVPYQTSVSAPAAELSEPSPEPSSEITQ